MSASSILRLEVWLLLPKGSSLKMFGNLGGKVGKGQRLFPSFFQRLTSEAIRIQAGSWRLRMVGPFVLLCLGDL